MNTPDPNLLVQTYQTGYATAMQRSGTRDKSQHDGMVGGLMAVLERFGGEGGGDSATFHVPPPPEEKPQVARARRDKALQEWVEDFRADIPQGSMQLITDAFRGGASGLEYDAWIGPRRNRIPQAAEQIVEDAFHAGTDYEQWWKTEGYLPPDMQEKVAAQRAAEGQRAQEQAAAAESRAKAQADAASRTQADAEAAQVPVDVPQPDSAPAEPSPAPAPAQTRPAAVEDIQEDAHLTAQPPAP